MVCCSESFPFYSHLILTGREVFFPFPPHHLLTCVRLCSSPPVCNAVPSAAASTRRHCFSFPPHHLTCMCVFFTCVQGCSKCCCFHQKALFFLSTSSSYLYVCFLYLCAVLFQVLLLPPEGTVFPFHLITFLPVCVFSLPVCSAVPSAAASTRRHFFFLSTSSSYLYVCFLYLCAVLFQVLLLPPEGTFFSFPPHRLLTCMCFPPHLCAVLFRVLLRREQVLKVACNHLISTTMELKPMATSETAWCWVATDYTDNQPHVEQFAVKFKVSQEVFFVLFF